MFERFFKFSFMLILHPHRFRPVLAGFGERDEVNDPSSNNNVAVDRLNDWRTKRRCKTWSRFYQVKLTVVSDARTLL
jgi:hypothetical protein